MTKPQLIAAAEEFRDLALVRQPGSIAELARALDALVFAVHDAPEGDPADNELEPPERAHGDYKAAYDLIGQRYPDLGYYGVADPKRLPPDLEATIGDAVDDLADIVGDLERGIWRFENTNADDAFWHLRFDYRSHWGFHARELSLYLHALQFR